MSKKYKLIIAGTTLYKEIELNESMNEISIGTQYDCDVKLRGEQYLTKFKITLKQINENWFIRCSDSLYMTEVGQIRKFIAKKMTHGDDLSVEYEGKSFQVFQLTYMLDFDQQHQDYNLEINIDGVDKIVIGDTRDSNIIIKNEYIENHSMVLKWIHNELYYMFDNSPYGVFINGSLSERKQRLKDKDFISLAGVSFFYQNKKFYTSINAGVRCEFLPTRSINLHTSVFAYPKYNISPRFKEVLPEEDLRIQQPPPKANKQSMKQLLTMIPSVRSVIRYSLDKKEFGTKTKEREELYTIYLEEKTKLIEENRKKEREIKHTIYRSLAKSITEVENFGTQLFDRTKEDEDFLHVYLGLGTIRSDNQVTYNKQEFVDLKDPLSLKPEEIAKKYEYMENMPIYVDFKKANGVGIVGDYACCKKILSNITIDIVTRQFYGDVKLVYMLDERYIKDMSWIRWLPHVSNDELGIRNIVCDEESKNMVIEDIYRILSNREMTKKESNKTANDSIHYVVFISDVHKLGTHPISRYFKDGSEYGFTFVFMSDIQSKLPQGCREVILINEKKLIHTEEGNQPIQFEYEEITEEQLKSTAYKLSPIYVDEVSLENELTKNISIFEMLGILSVEDIDLTRNYHTSNVMKTMAAPIGVNAAKQFVDLDILDQKHGPHGLVAGTTGSGKSEILQTYIASMATKYHPHEVGFVIIDFKGGGMADHFENLPHLIGTITNIDGREINRSLESIKAEIVKRQEIFHQVKVANIKDYIKLYKSGEVSVPLPHLIIIVDEFAELKMEHSDFMAQLIKAARIGRSLGLHLILATQKPAGVVDPQIWTNSNFKLCLKVQTKEDSNEVIKSPLASEIVEPGRAYFQVGNNEIFELFQSAYSGANVPTGNSNQEKIYTIFERNIWGKRKAIYTNKQLRQEGGQLSQLKAIVEYINDYCAEVGIKKLPGICLPSLQERINVTELEDAMIVEDGICATIGKYDDPQMQEQGYVTLDLLQDNVYIVGSPQSGKTTLLQTIFYSLVSRYTPSQVNIYIVDCGSMVMKTYEQSNYVGGVVLPTDEEKCKNLFKMLKDMIVKRKNIFMSCGVSTYSAYLESGYEDLPLICLMIDNYGAFKEYFQNEEGYMNRLAQDAIGTGISIVVTANNANAMSYKNQAYFGEKIVLNCHDTGEYSNVLGHCRKTPREYPGSGLCIIEKRILELQVAIFGTSIKEIQRIKEQKEYILKRNQEVKGKAIRIPEIPRLLRFEQTTIDYPQLFKQPTMIPIGMSYSSVDFEVINMKKQKTLTLLGNKEEKETFIQNFMYTLYKMIMVQTTEVYMIDDKHEPFKEFAQMGFVKSYTSKPIEGIDMVIDFVNESMDQESDEWKVLIINHSEVFKKINAEKTLSKQLCDVLKMDEELKVFMLFANVENQSIGFGASDLMKSIKENKNILSFMSLAEMKLLDISSKLKNDTNYIKGDAYYFTLNMIDKLKVFE